MKIGVADVAVSDWGLESNSACRHYGTHVSEQFRRVYGDDQDRAHRCGEGYSFRRLSRGSGAGVDVAIPDPELGPRRHGPLSA